MRTIAVVQAKGGVGKSTVAVHLACGLADGGRETILIDLDPSRGASECLGVESERGRVDLWDVLNGRAELLQAVVPVPGVSKLRVVPHGVASYEALMRSLLRLRVVLAPLRRSNVEYVILDTPPSWSPSTARALAAADEALAVTEPRTLSLQALGDQMRLIEETRARDNPALRLLGIVPNRVMRTRLARSSIDHLRASYPGRVLPSIRESARIAECPQYRMPVSRYAPQSAAAHDFDSLTRAVIRLTA
ncbi:MAG: ParA family protein [Acidobacteriota bacterium]|nr:MAG: ParA family protein [Acidobacteriota bacterium]